MNTLTLSSKGQLVLPKSIRDMHHWDAGTRFIIVDNGAEILLRPAKPFETTEFESPDSKSVYKGSPLSLEDMERAISIEAGKHK